MRLRSEEGVGPRHPAGTLVGTRLRVEPVGINMLGGLFYARASRPHRPLCPAKDGPCRAGILPSLRAERRAFFSSATRSAR